MSERATKWSYCLVRPYIDISQRMMTAQTIRFNEDINRLANYEFQQLRSIPKQEVSAFTALFWATIGSLGQEGWELVHYHSAIQPRITEDGELYHLNLEAILKKPDIDSSDA